MNGKLLRIESCCKRKTRNGYKNKKGDSFMRLRQEIKAFLMDEEAIGTVEVVLLLVLIGLVIIFKKQIRTLLDSIFKEINKQTKEVY